VRILHVTDHYMPVLGGIETHVHGLAHRQAARGDDVTVLTSTRPDADGRHDDDRGPVRVVRERAIKRAVRSLPEDYDVVHAHISVAAPFTSPVAYRFSRRRLPVVVTVHSMWNTLRPVPAWHVDATGLRRARGVTWTAVSSVVADQVARQLPRGVGVGVLPNAVEASPRPRTPPPGGPVELLSTMRIARRKRPLHLLEIFAGLVESTAEPVRLTVVGDGPWRDRFDRLAQRMGLSDLVTVTGRVEPDEVFRRLHGADVYVAPAVLESFGLAALEARCVGLPVVGRAGCGMSSFVHDGVEGWLCPSDTAMVEQLRLLVEDDALRWQVSEHNRSTPSLLTWEHALDRHDMVYELAAERLGRRRLPTLLSWGGREPGR
jgi:glycosyltransferase involved in cell wall biosynthesis